MAHSKQYVKLMNSVRWQRLRLEWMNEHPLCQECRAKGLVVAARCVHHITPIESAKTDRGMEMLAFSTTNLMSLCFRCHGEIHKAERSHSKEAHKQRQEEALARWKERRKNINPGGGFY